MTIQVPENPFAMTNLFIYSREKGEKKVGKIISHIRLDYSIQLAHGLYYKQSVNLLRIHLVLEK